MAKTVTRARGMIQVARDAGLSRESLYKRYRRQATRTSPPFSRWFPPWAFNCMAHRQTQRMRPELP